MCTHKAWSYKPPFWTSIKQKSGESENWDFEQFQIVDSKFQLNKIRGVLESSSNPFWDS
jgi:hypothetical protein